MIFICLDDFSGCRAFCLLSSVPRLLLCKSVHAASAYALALETNYRYIVLANSSTSSQSNTEHESPNTMAPKSLGATKEAIECHHRLWEKEFRNFLYIVVRTSQIFLTLLQA